MKVARIYLRVSTEEQELERQEALVDSAKASGYYVAGVYREKASGATLNRPEMHRMIHDLQPGEVVIAEKIDRITRLPLDEAEALIKTITDKGAKLAIPGIVDLSELAEGQGVIAGIVLKAVQEMLLRLALQMARDDYEVRRTRQREGIEIAKREGKYGGRKPNLAVHKMVVDLRTKGSSIAETAKMVRLSPTQVKRIWAAREKGTE